MSPEWTHVQHQPRLPATRTNSSGRRACASVAGRDQRIWSRNGQPLLERFPDLGALTEVAAGRDMVLDGEIVAIDRAMPA
ncbi:hypothetical protein [Lentzea sp. NPDC092896]|uniref:ATP-dependent DNA ligase n=1 Tax=Lentzea sp. NPDC092896 TaxID=3364127 RepID=UPI00381E2E80